MTANQVQHDAPVNVAGRFAPGNLEIVQIYLSHLERLVSNYLLPPFAEGQFSEHDKTCRTILFVA